MYNNHRTVLMKTQDFAKSVTQPIGPLLRLLAMHNKAGLSLSVGPKLHPRREPPRFSIIPFLLRNRGNAVPYPQLIGLFSLFFLIKLFFLLWYHFYLAVKNPDDNELSQSRS